MRRKEQGKRILTGELSLLSLFFVASPSSGIWRFNLPTLLPDSQIIPLLPVLKCIFGLVYCFLFPYAALPPSTPLFSQFACGPALYLP